MLACYSPRPVNENNIGKLLNKQKLQKCRFMHTINLKYREDKDTIDSILKYILANFCQLSVLGFDKSTGKHWCKKFKKITCEMYLEIEVIDLGYDLTEVRIVPIITDIQNVKKFVYDLNEGINLYKTSSFIKSCLQGGFL